MNRYLLLCSLSIFLISFPARLPAEEIRSFRSDIFIGDDGIVSVEEDIEYDFGRARRHGIFRTIPYKYKFGLNNFNLRMTVYDVTDFDNNEYKHKTSEEGRYLKIRIGDPDRKIQGLHDYRIDYSVKRAIVSFEDHDELYWNVTGNEWDVPIESSAATVYFEADVPEGTKAKCFTGPYGSQRSDCVVSIGSNRVEFRSVRGFNAGEGLTIVVGFPKGIVHTPSLLTKLFWFLGDNLHWGLPIFVLLGMYYTWHTLGRDPEGRVSIQVRYEPPRNLTPAEAGTIIDESADIKDITSTVIDLAVRGYIRIEEIDSAKFVFFSDKDYRLVKVKEIDTHLKPYEIRILSGLFVEGETEVLTSELKNKFYKHLPQIKVSLYKKLTKDRYFAANPDKIRNIYRGVGVIIFLLAIFFVSALGFKIAAIISGIIIAVFAGYMPKKTRKGVRANEEILGFKEFIQRVEADRIKRLATDDPTLFDRVLPFALVFGLEDKWADAFQDMYTEPPEWYSSSHYRTSFTPHLFVTDLGRSLNVLNSALSSKPKGGGHSGGSGLSGGGGFSGGGFGGGGGGSW